MVFTFLELIIFFSFFYCSQPSQIQPVFVVQFKEKCFAFDAY
jgi:hypothetical protein